MVRDERLEGMKVCIPHHWKPHQSRQADPSSDAAPLTRILIFS